MSADNWANCPRCIKLDQDEISEMRQNILDQYGKITVEAYEKLLVQYHEEMKNLESKHLEYQQSDYSKYSTFREDYEFYGAETGTLEISYSGQCTKCGLKLQFKEEKEFYKGEK